MRCGKGADEHVAMVPGSVAQPVLGLGGADRVDPVFVAEAGAECGYV